MTPLIEAACSCPTQLAWCSLRIRSACELTNIHIDLSVNNVDR